MDKQEAIRLFIKRNSGLFKQEPFPWEVYKKLKRTFFVEQHKLPPAKDSEIAGEILEGMIVSRQIMNDENLNKILILDFFSTKVQNKPYYFQRLEAKSKQAVPLIDANALKSAETSEKIRKEIREELKKECIEDLNAELKVWEEKVSQKKQEYYSFPSILDGAEYPLPVIQKSDTPAEFFAPWWVQLGLIENPFKELEGLYKQDQVLFNDVIHKTSIFLKYDAIIENFPSELFKNVVFYGGFGSGKTTFFDYIAPKLNQNKIISIYVQLGAEFEVARIISDFYKEANLQLMSLFPIYSGDRFPFNEGLDDEHAILQMMMKLVCHDAKGFVFFIDDLHKGDDNKSMQFLSHLQVLASKWRRGTNLKIGFCIAGANEWLPIIKKFSKFSGSVDDLEKMPELQLEAAYDAVNRRLKAYAKNPENPRQIERSFIERIYHNLQGTDGDLTFRGIMRAVHSEFKDGHFDVLHSNPLNLKDRLNEIRPNFTNNPSLYAQISSLTGDTTLDNSQKSRCFELLINIYLSDGIDEDQIRKQDVPFLQRLLKAGLIVKVIDKTQKWKISKELDIVNSKIIQQFSLSLEDYLEELFLGKSSINYKASKPENDEFAQLEKLITFVKRDLQYHFLIDVKTLHYEILKSENKYLDLEIEPSVSLSNCTKSLAKLTKAFILSQNGLLPQERDEDIRVLYFWKDFWWSPETIMQYVRAVSSTINDSQKMAIAMSRYREAFSQILTFFVSEWDNSKFFSIPLNNLTNEEIRLLHQCRQFLQDFKDVSVAEKLVQVLDAKMRALLFNIFTLLYDDSENRLKWLDEQSRMSIIANLQKDRLRGIPVSKNEFLLLNRSNYTNIVTGLGGRLEGRRNWNAIFQSVFSRNSEDELYEYLSMLTDIDYVLTYFQDGSFDQNKVDFLFDFMQKSKRFMVSINSFYFRLLNIYITNDSKNIIFKLAENETKSSPINITAEDKKIVIDILKSKPLLGVWLDDQSQVEGTFGGISYRKVYAILSLLCHGLALSTDKEEKTYKLDIIGEQTPFLQVALRVASLRNPTYSVTL